jgi:hypothetical protein
MREFLNEYLGIWPEPKYPKELYDLAREFLYEVECYDRKVCSGPIKHGSIIPANGKEYDMVRRNYECMKRHYTDVARSYVLLLGEFRELCNEIDRREQYPYGRE